MLANRGGYVAHENTRLTSTRPRDERATNPGLPSLIRAPPRPPPPP